MKYILLVALACSSIACTSLQICEKNVSLEQSITNKNIEVTITQDTIKVNSYSKRYK